MAEIKFSCPHCQQHIAADSGYGGMQIACPTCNGSLIVPGAPAPPAAAALKVRVATHSAQPASAPSAPGCPSCGSALPHGAVLCINCGYNLSTGQRMVAGRSAPLGKPEMPSGETPWYKSSYPYLGAFFLLLGALYLLGRENRDMMVAFWGVAALYSLGVHVVVLVVAFKESVGTGFLTLCIPFYAIYFVFKVNDSDTLKLFYGVAAILNITLRFIL